MSAIIRSRVHAGTGAVLVILIILLVQNQLSQSTSMGSLAYHSSGSVVDEELSNLAWRIIKVVAFVPVIIFWALDSRRYLAISVVLSNALLTFQLVVSTMLLVITLGEDTPSQASLLINDTVLVMAINILIFSLWYWLIDSPLIRRGTKRESEAWDFLFPQRAGSIQRYDRWNPSFWDYLYLAFTTSFTFGPADTLPLSQRAKALMLLQATISVVTIVVLAGRALTILSVN